MKYSRLYRLQNELQNVHNAIQDEVNKIIEERNLLLKVEAELVSILPKPKPKDYETIFSSLEKELLKLNKWRKKYKH